MEITFLGTNGWFDTHTGSTTCVLAETENAYIIFDAGGGLYKTFDIIKDDKPVYLLLSHLHMDHIQGLQFLNIFNWKSGVKIILADEMKKELEAIMRPPFMQTPQSHKMKVDIIPVSQAKDLPFKLEYKELLHIVPTIGFRVQSEGKTLVYGLDSGPCANLTKLAKEADLFITECSFLPGQTPNKIHLNPQQAAQTALDANAKLMALIHFKADDYTTLEQRDEALAAAGHIFAATFAPYDGEKFVI